MYLAFRLVAAMDPVPEGLGRALAGDPQGSSIDAEVKWKRLLATEEYEVAEGYKKGGEAYLLRKAPFPGAQPQVSAE